MGRQVELKTREGSRVCASRNLAAKAAVRHAVPSSASEADTRLSSRSAEQERTDGAKLEAADEKSGGSRGERACARGVRAYGRNTPSLSANSAVRAGQRRRFHAASSMRDERVVQTRTGGNERGGLDGEREGRELRRTEQDALARASCLLERLLRDELEVESAGGAG